MVDVLKDAKFIVLAKPCTSCGGTGHLERATFNTDGLPSYNPHPSTAVCPVCVSGFVFQRMDVKAFLSQVADHVVTEMTGSLRGRWYDLVVSELEMRIKNAELQILGQVTAKGAQRLARGDRVALTKNLTSGYRTFAPGTVGTISRCTFDAGGRLISADLELPSGECISVNADELEKVQ